MKIRNYILVGHQSVCVSVFWQCPSLLQSSQNRNLPPQRPFLDSTSQHSDGPTTGSRVSKTILSWASSMQKTRSKFRPYLWGSQHYRLSNHDLRIVFVYVLCLQVHVDPIGWLWGSLLRHHPPCLSFSVFFSFLCVYGDYACVYACSYVRGHKCTCVCVQERPEVDNRNLPQSLFHSVLRDTEYLSNSEFTGTTNLASQLAQL